ncbi:unnamed protein product [Fraxinus pennsylvanica]|uniref:PPM-type phosphatase domain-containing protein n=1 Tax=Fraxinus pennsylvanica TaxID=56036 RepID=A0AAD2EB32_9LAMI|nr:unnamed protein product [Fraxinus pennsylvanica]
MGMCYSTIGAKKGRDQGRNLHLKSKKSSSCVFSKLTGDGGGGAAAASVAVVEETQIPGRLFANGTSRIASLYTQQGQKGTNQDSMIVWENFCTRSDMNATFCGVFDGHGPYGHMVSRKVRDALPLLLRAEWEAKLNIHQNSGHENGDAERKSHFDNSVDDDRGAKLNSHRNSVHENGDTDGMSHFDNFVDDDRGVELNGHQNSVHENGDAKGMSHFSNFVDGDGGAKVNSHRISVHENGDAEGMSHFDNSVNDDGGDSVEVEEKDEFPEMHMPLKKSILKAFKLMDKELKLHDTINSFCSGTTAVGGGGGEQNSQQATMAQGQDLIIGNIGDSRAVLATRDDGNALMAVQLTVDLKPNLPREAARIRKFKGRVFALKDEPEVTRVWLPTSNSPGLAMARAFGDFCLKDFGLISIPDVYYHHINERDEFVILATDGVWDVLSNKEAVDIVASAPDSGTATRALVNCATRAWKFKYPASKNDDCAAICIFLKHVYSIDVLEAQNGATKAHEEDMKKILVPTPGGMEISNEALADIIVHSCTNTNESSMILPVTDVAEAQNDVTNADKEETKKVLSSREEDMGISDEARATAVVHSVITKESSEIVPVVDEVEEKPPGWSLSQFKRSLAECLSTADDEWSALEGIARVNSLLSLPRLSSKT